MERSEIRGETLTRMKRCALHPGYERTRFNPIHLSNSPREQCSATRFNWVPGHPSVLSFRFPKGEGGAPQGAERFMAPFGAPAAALVKRSEECFTNPRRAFGHLD